MRRREAIRIFKEICKCIPDLLVNAVSVNPRNRFKKDFELRIDLAIYQKSLADVEAIARKHNMTFEENQGIISIYEARTIEIVA